MGTASCLSEEQLAAYVSGHCELADGESIEAHLEECSRCRSRLDAYRFEPGFLANVRAAAREQSHDDGMPRSTASVGNVSTPNGVSFPEIPGYQILREIGRGGMGIVYDAIQTKLNRPVALKVLPSMMTKISTTAVKRFRSEASAAARLHHNNIVPIYDFGESEGAYYFAMELIDGEPLHRVIHSLASGISPTALPTQLTELPAKHSINHDERSADSGENKLVACRDDDSIPSSSPASSGEYYRQVARWMRDVADALHHAHNKGIIHRDIKPANLILASDGRLMVADFGLAKSADTESVTVTGSLVGTWRYMSPEQALARRMPVDHRTDIYSLAATMYELLTFRHAFPGSDEKEIISKVITEEPLRPRKIIRSVPAELETICLKAMEKSRDARYDTAAAFADEFRRYLNDLPIVARPPGPIVRARKFAKRHRGAVSIVAALALFIATATGWIYNRSVEKTRKLHHIETAIEQGNSFMALEDWQAAESSFNEARSLDPNNVVALGNLARVKKESYNSPGIANRDPSLLEQANSLCDKALALDTRRAHYGTLLNVKGVVLKMLGRYDEAIETYKRAMEFDQTSSAPLINLGTLFALKHDLDEASIWFNRAVQMLSDPSIASEGGCMPLHLNLGALLLFRSNPTAGEHLNMAHNCMHGHVPTLTLLARSCLELHNCDDRHNARYFAEVADFNAAESDAKAKRILALAYLRDGSFDEAVRAATSAIELGDLETVDRLILALAHAKLGDHRIARTDLVLARNTWPETLNEPGKYTVQAPAGNLWFESADELLALRTETEALLDTAGR